jgi:hypothetical protein
VNAEISAEPLDPFELGRREGAESGAQEPLTEAQQRTVRTMLRLADTQTPPAKAS